LDGFIARRYNLKTIVGSIIDPMADKALMTVLTVTLAMQSLIPSKGRNIKKKKMRDMLKKKLFL
jgi:phosphatidylserine synthase